jgi:hypothetical protein
MNNIKFSFFIIINIIFSFSVLSQIPVDYQSQVAADESISPNPIGISQGNLGPYTAHNRLWVFYSDGTNAVWRTKQAEEGGSWSEKQAIYNILHGNRFNVAFDGEYFHFVRVVNNHIYYQRGLPLSDGSFIFTAEQIAWSDTTYNADPRYVSIAADEQTTVWITFQAQDGENRKPVAIASIATDGRWIDREGFPQDLQEVVSNSEHGRGNNVMVLAGNTIFFSWRDEINGTMSARVWDNGTFDDIEDTGLPGSSNGSSVVILSSGVVIINSGTNIVRRNLDGSYSDISPLGMVGTNYNSLSKYGTMVRLWDYENDNIRYRETTNEGNTWSLVVEKWNVPDLVTFSATQAKGSHGDHHSLLWSQATSPYNIFAGIEGIFRDVTSVYYLPGEIPTEYRLEQNYPNPFNPTTTIRFALPTESTVRFDIYNILGQKVATLINREHYSAGRYEVVWDAHDEYGRELSSGIYIGRISTDIYNSTVKMILAR